ncbi:MAG TPA: hypothetical protein DDW50_05715 [Firmicutes bacterium]|nr:hypothetical protein [Bacillota bacterium]
MILIIKRNGNLPPGAFLFAEVVRTIFIKAQFKKGNNIESEDRYDFMIYAKEPPRKTSYVSINTLIQPRNGQRYDSRSAYSPNATKEQPVIQAKQSEGKENTAVTNESNNKAPEKAGPGLGDQAVSKGLTGAAWFIEKMPAVNFAPVPGFEFMQKFFKGMMVGSLERLSQEKVADLWGIIQNVAKAVTSSEYMKAYFWGFLRGFAGDFLMIWELPGTIKSTAQFMGNLIAKMKELSKEDLQGFTSRITEIKALVVDTGTDYVNTILKDIKAGKSSELIIEILKAMDSFSQDAGISVGGQLTGAMLAYFSKDQKELGKDLGGIMGELSGTVAFTALLAAITSGAGAVWGGVRAGIKTVSEIIGKGVGKAVEAIGTVCENLSLIFGKFIEGAMVIIKGFPKGASKLFKGIKGKLDEILVKVKGLIEDVLGKLSRKPTRKSLPSGAALPEKTGEAAEKKISKEVLDETAGKTGKEIKGEGTENAEKLVAKGPGNAIERAIERGTSNTWEKFLSANPGKSIDEVSNSYIKLIEDQSPWPEGFVPQQRVLKSGDTFQMALDSTQPVKSPGRFGTFDNIPNLDYVRNNLAVKSDWKVDCSKVVTYKVKPGVELPVLEGRVGPQIDINADKYLAGGGTQIQLLLDRVVNISDYLEVVSVRSIK